MTTSFSRSTAVLSALVLVFLAACAGSRETSGPTEPEDELPTPAVRISDYEDFDPAEYPERPPEAEAVVDHDVPDKLMQGTADAGVQTTVQGYRVQIYSTLDKNAALSQEEGVKEWWRRNRDTAPPGIFSGEMSVSVVYIQPYYRVRVGNFTSRDAADRARRYLSQQYPDAFIVPDTVTVTR